MPSAPVVDARQLATLRLAELDDHACARMYATLLEASFPPAELMSLEELDQARRSGDCDGLVLLDRDEPVAAMVTEDYLDGRVRLLAYVAVAGRLRGLGVGAHLVSVLRREAGHRLVLAEIEDPRFHPPARTGDPVARARFYAQQGWRLLPLDYCQPSLRPGSPRVEHLLLIALTGGPDVDGELVAEFLEEYFDACEGEPEPGDERREDLVAAARGDDGGRLPLLPVSELVAARPDPA